MIMNAGNRMLIMHICLLAASETVTTRHDVTPCATIVYGGFQKLPPRSPDLTPVDFFLWGYLKQQVYATPPPTFQDLQRRITDACANVTTALLHRVQREFQASVQMCSVADREKFEH
ncbi:hypothetical protein AVEN_160298-1 [Araneus ventricosus]|uniref:Uncharacterized protein n=1 Tax=Araneus ventricosus TaxID=182803 RepID=A0A4Y2L4S9_ARAVE|nr:hypothetical protein AVEN_160298-1 [Araneus ventricosus]